MAVDSISETGAIQPVESSITDENAQCLRIAHCEMIETGECKESARAARFADADGSMD